MNRFLFDFRDTPHCTTGESPAKLMFGRALKTRFSLLKPPLVTEQIVKSQKKSIQNHKGKRNIHFKVGKKVIIRNYTNPNKAGWVPAVIQKKLGKRHYDCLISHNGRVDKRHLDQIRDSFDSSESISTNTNDQQTSKEHSDTESDALNDTLASELHDDSQVNASDVDGSLYDGNSTVDNSDSTMVSSSGDDTFLDAVSTTPRPPVRASALNAMDKLDALRRADRI